MEELKIFRFQAKRIEDTLRLVANALQAYNKDTCLNRDIMQSWEMIQNVLDEHIEKQVDRFKKHEHGTITEAGDSRNT